MNKPKKRKELLDKLNHNPPLNEKRTKWFSSLGDALKNIKTNKSNKVLLISSASELDRKEMTFEKAISEVTFHGWGTIIGITTTLAIYYGESGERAAVIQQSA